MTPASIRALIAASDGSDQGEILEAAYLLLIPKPDWNVDLDAFVHWDRPYQRFHRMVEIGAQESAALLIAEAVLPGCDYTASTILAGKGGTAVIELADGKGFFSEALNDGTPSLAIIDAVCAAKEKGPR